MPKKTFKDSTAHLNRFFSYAEPEPAEETEETEAERETHGARGTHVTQRTQETQEAHISRRTHGTDSTREIQGTQESRTLKKKYRLNLKLKACYRDYLEDASWKAHKSITQYISDLIAADIAAKGITDA